MTSKIAKAPHAERSARHAVYGHAANKGEDLQDNDWTVSANQARRAFAHVATGHARVRPDSHVQD